MGWKIVGDMDPWTRDDMIFNEPDYLGDLIHRAEIEVVGGINFWKSSHKMSGCRLIEY